GGIDVGALSNGYFIAGGKVLHHPADDTGSIALGMGAAASISTGTNNTIIGNAVASTTLATGSGNILIGTSNAVDTPAADTNDWLNIGNTIYGNLTTGSIALGAAAVTAGTTLDMSARTDSIIVPKGTELERPAGVEGMIRYNTETYAFEGYQGATPGWSSLGTGTGGGGFLGADAANTSPSRSDDVTTGLFSDTAEVIQIAIAGTERLRVTAAGTTTAGVVDLAAITDYFAIAGAKVLHQPASDTTSIGVGSGSLAAQTATNAQNMAVGAGALTSTTTGYWNTGVGYDALYYNTIGLQNTAVGRSALYSNWTGSHNTAVGTQAGYNMNANSDSTFIGFFAGLSVTGGNNTVIGSQVASTTLSTGSNNILIGTSSLVDTATAGTSNWLNIGNTIYGNLTTGSIALGAAAVTAGAILDLSGATSTAKSSMILPKDTTANRPTAGVTGMIRYNTTTYALEVYQGSTPAWVSLGAAGASTLGAAVGTPSPYRSGQATTGLYSDTAGVVQTGIVGVERLRVTATGISVTGDVNVAAITNAYSIAGTKILYQPASDTTSIAVGPSALAAQTIASIYNTALGYSALSATTTGTSNTAVGYNVMNNNITGGYNTAMARGALGQNTAGSNNSAYGYQALYYTASNNNTGVGFQSGYAITTGTNNTVLGNQVAFATLTTGSNNILIGTSSLVTTPAAATSSYLNIGNAIKLDMTAVTATNPIMSMGGASLDNTSIALGLYALQAQTVTNAYNTAIGWSALTVTTTGTQNTAVGYAALDANTIGTRNTAAGYNALSAMTTGTRNSGVGAGALATNIIGSYNTAVGDAALNVATGDDNTALGKYAGKVLTTGTDNLIVGTDVASTVLTTGSRNILIGTSAAVTTPAAGTNDWLNIGGTIYGDLATGRVALGAAAVTAGAILDLSGATSTAKSSMILP
ncbi:MAG TPA: hypothetical protein DCY07_01310, partial [Rhodospirillaceae bacterium]|nr:hypothetical protein [Rhodospirillaceae bacterium]